MVRRNLSSAFVGGVYIFPGGALDRLDGDPARRPRLCQGRDESAASTLLGAPGGGLAYWVAALRECFEEAGVLVADGPDGLPLSFADPVDGGPLLRPSSPARTAERQLSRDVPSRRADSWPPTGRHYFAHWITPEGPAPALRHPVLRGAGAGRTDPGPRRP